MASQTSNLHLTLPTGTENVSRQIINTNMSTIDAAVGAVPSGQNLQSQVTNLANESSSLKSAIVNGWQSNQKMNTVFINGGIANDGTINNELYRIVMQDIYTAERDLFIEILPHFRILIAYYDSQNTYIKKYYWITGRYYLPKGTHFRIQVAREESAETSGVVDIGKLQEAVSIMPCDLWDIEASLVLYDADILNTHLSRMWTFGMYDAGQGKFIIDGYQSIMIPYKFPHEITVTNQKSSSYQFNVKRWRASEAIAANYLGTSGWKTDTYTIPANTYFTIEYFKLSGSIPTPTYTEVATWMQFTYNAQKEISNIDIDNVNRIIKSESLSDTLAEIIKKQLTKDMLHKYFNGSAVVDAPTYYCHVSAHIIPVDVYVDFSGKQYKVALFNGDSENQIETTINWATTKGKIPANTYFMISAQDTTAHSLEDWYGYFNVEISKDISEKNNDFVLPAKTYASSYSVPNRFQLLWFSDIHATNKNLTRIMQYAEENKDGLSDIICTGDMVSNLFTDDYTFWHTCGADKVLTVIGNHDGWKNGTWATQAEIYEKFFAPYISEWGVTYESGYLNWYKVYNSKVMLIALAPYSTNQTEADELITFLTNALNIAKTNSYAVVIAHHYPVNPSSTTLYNTPFTTPNRTPEDLFIQPDVIATVESFRNAGGEFVCYITGHTHADRTAYITENRQIVLTIGTAATWPGIQDNSQFRDTVHLKYYDLFNIFYVDPVCKIVSIKRIGSDRDMWFRKLDSLAINYVTGEIIS